MCIRVINDLHIDKSKITFSRLEYLEDILNISCSELISSYFLFVLLPTVFYNIFMDLTFSSLNHCESVLVCFKVRVHFHSFAFHALFLFIEFFLKTSVEKRTFYCPSPIIRSLTL